MEKAKKQEINTGCLNDNKLRVSLTALLDGLTHRKPGVACLRTLIKKLDTDYLALTWVTCGVLPEGPSQDTLYVEIPHKLFGKY